MAPSPARRAYLDQFVRREAFLARYPTGQTPAAYVAALDQNAGHPLTPAESADLVARLSDGRETRATALRRVAEHAALRAAEFNQAFVLLQYMTTPRIAGWRPGDQPAADAGDPLPAAVVRLPVRPQSDVTARRSAAEHVGRARRVRDA